jgi:hypothetical protein
MGMFLGFSHKHFSLVPLVLNLRTGHVSPQYHVIFDDNFETVPSLNPNYADIDDKFATLFNTTARDFYLDQIDDDDCFSLPPLDASWIDNSLVPEGDSAVPEGDSATPEGVSPAFDFYDNPLSLQRQSRTTRNRSPAYAATIILASTTLSLATALHQWAVSRDWRCPWRTVLLLGAICIRFRRTD